MPISEVDHILTAQLVVAWAGEGGEEKRLGWSSLHPVQDAAGEALLDGHNVIILAPPLAARPRLPSFPCSRS